MGSRALPTLPPPSPRSFFKSLRRSISPRFVCLWAGANEGPTDKSPQISLPPSLLMSFVPRRRRSHEERRTERLFSNLLLPPYPEKGGKGGLGSSSPSSSPFVAAAFQRRSFPLLPPLFPSFSSANTQTPFPYFLPPSSHYSSATPPPLFRVHFWFLIKAHAAADARPRKRGGLFSPPLFPLSLRGAS